MKLSIARVSVSSSKAPHLFQHALAGNGFAFVLNQVAENIGLHESQRKCLFADPELQKVELHRFVTKRECVPGLGRCGNGALMIQRGAQPLVTA